MKTPLLVANDSRDESREKDSWGTNILLESEAPTAAVKRPGLTLTYDGTTTGQGVFIWPEYGGSTVVTIEDDELTFPVVVEIGDFIDGYYAMVENPPTPPGPGDDYWSETPPTSDRWRAIVTVALTAYPSSIYPTNLIGGQAGSKLAAAKTFVLRTMRSVTPGLKTLYIDGGPWAVNSKIFNTSYSYVEEFGQGHIKQTTQTHNDFITYPDDWPANCGVWTGMFSEPDDVIGHVCKKKTNSSFTLESTGSVGRISTATFALPGEAITTLIEISGCDQSAYNGTFYTYRDPENISDGYLYFNLASAPGVSPATGTKSITYWVDL